MQQAPYPQQAVHFWPKTQVPMHTGWRPRNPSDSLEHPVESSSKYNGGTSENSQLDGVKAMMDCQNLPLISLGNLFLKPLLCLSNALLYQSLDMEQLCGQLGL